MSYERMCNFSRTMLDRNHSSQHIILISESHPLSHPQDHPLEIGKKSYPLSSNLYTTNNDLENRPNNYITYPYKFKIPGI